MGLRRVEARDPILGASRRVVCTVPHLVDHLSDAPMQVTACVVDVTYTEPTAGG